jgi:hypothetical protein
LMASALHDISFFSKSLISIVMYITTNYQLWLLITFKFIIWLNCDYNPGR